MVARTRFSPVNQEDRAEAVATALLGTCDSLDEHASEDERSDLTFARELDSRVRRCASCAWWFEADELDRQWCCEECRGGEL